MIVDGIAIARSILADVARTVAMLPQPPRLTVFTCAPNFETKKFLALKQKRAAEVGILVTVVEFGGETAVPEMVQAITAAHQTSDGIVVQLPFPASIAIAEVLSAVLPSHDVDALTYDGSNTTILPPVVGAIDAIARHHQIQWSDQSVVIVGAGRLVGAPAALFAIAQNARVTVLHKDTVGSAAAIAAADILILGAGVPGLITSNMVKDGVVIFDGGTSEEGGVLVGDAVPSVAEKAALLTPVPGGIGPITVAVLLRNVLALATRS